MSLRLPLAIAATLMLAPATAYASPMQATEFEALVSHRDLDLTTAEGVSRLDERVRTRVRQMCRGGGRDLDAILRERECQTGALAATAPAVRLAIANARLENVRMARNTSGQNSPASPTATPGG